MNVCRVFLVIVLMAGVTSYARSVAAQNSTGPEHSDWPGFNYGYTEGFFRTGPFEVDFQGLVSESVAKNRLYRPFAPLQVRREQAQAFKEFYQSAGAFLTPSWQTLDEAHASGDQQRISAAARQLQKVVEISREVQPNMFKDMVVDVMDSDQLETIKSLCVNVVMERAGFDTMMRAKSETIAAHGLSREELREIAKAMAEAELELQKEIIQLRRKAWDKVMAKFPPELVKQLEEEMGFGGLEKPKK